MKQKSSLKINTIAPKSLGSKIREYVSCMITDQISLEYHNLAHTKSVVNWKFHLSKKEQILDDKICLLIIAAWFHDTGFAIDYKDHEVYSVAIMEDFLKNDFKLAEIEFIKDCILATRLLQKPENVYQSIICDEDLAHLGSSDYNMWHQRLRKEWKEVLGRSYTDSEWFELNLEFFKKHNYHTESAKNFFSTAKKMNTLMLDTCLISNGRST